MNPPPDRLEFFFDLSSPWTCLAFHNLPGVESACGVTAQLRPILVGGVFNAVNPAVYAMRDQPDNRRFQHSWKVLHDWAALAGYPLHFPSPFHPAKSVHAMRFACVLEDDQAALRTFCTAVFRAYFTEQRNLDDVQVLTAAATDAGLDGAAIRAASTGDAAKTRLRANTDELIARGGYGSPTLFVDGEDIYFGNDQLVLVTAALKRDWP